MAFDPNIGRASQWKKGVSGNPGGRSQSRLISEALRVKVAEVKPDDAQERTYARILADNLVEIATCRSPTRSPTAVAATNLILDRLEGRARQQIELDVTQQLRDKSGYELQFYLDHGRWPEEEDAETPSRAH